MGRDAERLLVRRIRAGEREACAELVRSHHVAVYRLLLHLSRDAHAAEDLTQEAFATAWLNIGGFNGSASLATWLHRIAYCKFIDWRRRAEVRGRGARGGSADGDAADAVRQLAAAAPGPLDELLAGESAQRLSRAVGALEECERQVIVLHYFQGLSFREAAVVLGRPAGTVKWQVSRALCRLRERLHEDAMEQRRQQPRLAERAPERDADPGVPGRAGSTAEATAAAAGPGGP